MTRPRAGAASGQAKVANEPAPIFVSVVHTFNAGKADAWWAGVSEVMGDPAKMAELSAVQKKLGYVNHYFLPSSSDGTMANCLWECRDETAAKEFQEFIDGPHGPGATGGVQDAFVNDCYRGAPGAMALRRADLPQTGRGDARGGDVDIPWRDVAAAPRPRRG